MVSDAEARSGCAPPTSPSRRGAPCTPECSTRAEPTKSDVTATRLAADEYLIVSSAASTGTRQGPHPRNIPRGLHASVVDVTSGLAVFGDGAHLAGPALDADHRRPARRGFPVATSRSIPLGRATVRATRITYVGELGWELYVPAEFAVGVYEDLMSAGVEFDVAQGGYYAIESLRLEKGYRAFGRELTPGRTPWRPTCCSPASSGTDIGFLGRDAVEQARATGVRRRLVGFAVSSPEPMLWGGELILRDGAPCGRVTSAAWGETTGACVGLAYVRAPAAITADWIRMGTYDVNVGGRQYPIEYRCGLYDPANARIRS
jgi:4-methylaminobutanoate oxidase (formaldehyde-forming)